MMTRGGSPRTLTGVLDSGGVGEVARAERLEEAVGDVRIRLVDLVDQDHAAVLRVRVGIARRDGGSAELSLPGRALPVERPPEGAGTEESADGEARPEPLA